MPDETIPTDQIPPGFKLRHTLRGHKKNIFRVAWSPDGQMLASTSKDKTVRVWDTTTGRQRLLLKGHSAEVSDVTWSPDGQELASAGYDNTIRFWNAATGQQRLALKANPYSTEENFNWIASIAWSPDGMAIASAGIEAVVHILGVKTGLLLPGPKGGSSSIFVVAWSPDGQALAEANAGMSIRVWDTDSWRERLTLEGHSGFVFSLAWSPDGRTLASASENNTIRLWDIATGRLRVILEGHTDSVNSVSFSFDGRYLASKSVDGTVRLWRCDEARQVATLYEEDNKSAHSAFWPPSLAFHPTAPILATLGDEGTVIRIWDLDFDVLLGEVRERDDVLYTTARVALVGDSGVGKTGLGWKLSHGEFKEHPSTHGQQFWVIDEWGATRADKTQCEAVLWDLAGQPDYRLVHALFLDDVDLALVLFDPTNRQEPLKGVEYWLKHLKRERRDGRKRRVILVGARGDRGTPTLTRAELEEFCGSHGVECYVGTSAMTGEGLEELLARVKSSILWDEMPATVTTKTFKRVKEFVLSLKESTERKGVLVSPEELRTCLEATDAEWKFTDAEMITAVKHLANHGYVSVLRGSTGEETILLAPDLLANLAASFVLEARRNEKGLGALEEARVLEGRYEFPELKSLEKEERDVLLDAAVVLFIEHNLCFRETLGPQTLLIFPALINQKRPQLEETETVDDYSYRVTGAVENVYAALVVQLGYTNTFTRTNQWQNQAEYETAYNDVCGFRQVDEREGETELVLYHAKEKPGARLLFQGLFEQFLRGRDVTVTKFPPVECPECHYRQPRTEIVERIAEGKGFLFCSECGEKIVLPRAGEEVALSASERARVSEEQERTRRRTAFESALVRVKAVVRDEKKHAPSCFVSYAWGDDVHERWVKGLVSDFRNAGVEVVFDGGNKIGVDISRFISRIDDGRVDFVVAVGTQLYKRKYENEVSPSGSIVAAEVNLINQRLTGTNQEAETVLPLLLEGDERASFPPLMRRKVYADFRADDLYFPSLFDLILTLYGIPFEHPAISDLREAMRGRFMIV